MDIDPVAAAIVGAIGVVALVFAVLWLRKRARLMALPVLAPEQAVDHEGEAVVTGTAAGEEVTSPWSERTGAFFSAKEVVEERRQGGASTSAGSGSRSQRRRRSHDLGQVGIPLVLAGDEGAPRISVQPDGDIDIDHLPMMRTASQGSGGLNVNVGGLSVSGSGDQRSWVEEHAAFVGDRLYVAGTVTQQGGEPTIAGKVSLAGKDPSAQGAALLLRAGIAALVAVGALGFALVGLVG
ncbi:hypothetical protein ER308_10605 [Egibacter rhizosphaerae]|uniref:Uncharacterized protein n=1 Tax=Egibacter rhizosphaerae TaxID=1670831 RepID=A0A411YFE8_9ACTN|nr:hypothetical protein [Egibacter rhizosphaerae]QBI19965.1 hypothetical protein ER308_10605 [Egibacter rhizosphaerae]